jgi:hypothetical protein
MEEQRLWCRIGGIGRNALFGYTQEHELVLIARNYTNGGMQKAERGDFVSFIPRPSTRRNVPGMRPAKWFAHDPKLVAKKFTESAFVWKSEMDSTGDRFEAAVR